MAALLRRMPGYRPGVWAYVLDSPDAARSYARQMTSRIPELVLGSQNGLVSDQTAIEVGDRLGTREWYKLASAIDLLNYLPEDLLTKVDRASMAFALEVRVPLLDYRFVEFSARVPHEWKYRNKTTKHLLRKVLARYVPQALWERPKSGFAIPLTSWFRKELRPWVMDELTANWDWTFDVINRPLAMKMIEGHMQGRMNCAPLIWAMISWKHWVRRIGLLR
jgi:asparagine synthase (glutamine-hydrolysing)